MNCQGCGRALPNAYKSGEVPMVWDVIKDPSPYGYQYQYFLVESVDNDGGVFLFGFDHDSQDPTTGKMYKQPNSATQYVLAQRAPSAAP